MTATERLPYDMPWLRVGLEAWCFGLEATMLSLRTMRMVGELPFRTLPVQVETPDLPVTALAPVPDVAVEDIEPQTDHELLASVLPQHRDEVLEVPDEIRDAPLRMYPGSQNVVPWRYET